MDMARLLHYDDGFAFRFERPSEGRALRSVAFVNGVPELRFDRSEHTPTLTEEDVAIICRLVSEGTRPNFTFIGIPFLHPLYGRQYKEYDPPWLKGTEIGELLFELDWKMKCLNVGLQTDESKTVYFSREKTCKAKGLATFLDFDEPTSANKESRSIFLSCGEVQVQEYNDELVFSNDPKLSIESKCRPNYSKYITRVLPQIAKHDEPLFTKFQEVIKMCLAAEWLRDKGFEMSEKWMTNATCNNQQVARRACATAHNSLSTNTSCSNGTESLDISPNDEEAKNCKRVAEKEGGVWYGWFDGGSGEMVQFDGNGKLCAEIKSERISITQFVTVNGKKMNFEDWLKDGGMQLLLDVVSSNTKPGKDIMSRDEFTELEMVKMETRTSDGGAETTVMMEVQPGVKVTTVMRASANDLDYVFKGLPTGFPQVDSWNELHSQTVPWPMVWQTTRDGAGVQTAGGGVRTESARAVPERPRDGEHPRKQADQYSYTVSARCEGTIKTAAEHARLSASKVFQDMWKKGICPDIKAVFTITNASVQQQWERYKSSLTVKRVEQHFHGTALKCDVFKSKELCKISDCGICGISNEGFSIQHIRKTFQRFGKGFYLAPHSSKANDYAHEYNCGGVSYKAQLLCDVCPGTKYTLKETDQSLKGPPQGYDCVYGQVGGDLNYPEIVVYNEGAVMPRYIVVYTDG